MRKSKSIPNPHARKRSVLLRVNDDELRTLTGLAMRFTEGNVSKFVRLVSLNFNGKTPKGKFYGESSS